MSTENNDLFGQSQTPDASKKGVDWERDLLSRLAMSSLNEQRRGRRWGVFFKSLTFIYLTIFLIILSGGDWGSAPSAGKHTALVDVSGVIAAGSSVDAETIGAGLRAAFEDNNTTAVIMRINSPGGSPVQSGYIYDEMLRLRELYKDIPLYAVIEDVGASGGYYIAAGAEKIYADKASIVGSIGVRMDSFGFVETIKMLGIERRLMTAGENKAFLDPFLPEDDQSKQHVQRLLDEVHQQFISAVQRSRGDRIKQQDNIYSGLVWTGEKSLELGLVDGLGDIQHVARDIIKESNIRDFTPKQDVFERFARGLGAWFANSLHQLVFTQNIQ